MSGGALVGINLAAALFLTGLSWFLQVVHFPLLRRLDRREFPSYAALHQRNNTLLMTPPMLIEMITAAWLLVATPTGLRHQDLFHLFLLLVAIWLITFLRHIPLHRRLLQGYNAEILRTLERWNWIRTSCWTARAAFLFWLARFA